MYAAGVGKSIRPGVFTLCTLTATISVNVTHNCDISSMSAVCMRQL